MYIKEKSKLIFYKMFDIKNVLFTFKTDNLNLKFNKIKVFTLKIKQGSVIGFRKGVGFELVESVNCRKRDYSD